ncbi:MAG: PTS sugar transporter subunit IIB [candidate division WOR-3 bacterium]
MKILRIDDRLIHGQIIAGWIPNLGISNILLFNDSLPLDMLQIYKNMIPEDVNLEILNIDQVDKIPDENSSIYLFENIKTLKNNLNKLVNISFDIFNLGGMRNKENKQKILDFIYMDEKDIDDFFSIIESLKFKKINAQQLPTTQSFDIKRILEKRS